MTEPILDHRHIMQLTMCPPQWLQCVPTAGSITTSVDTSAWLTHSFLQLSFGAGWKFVQSAGSEKRWIIISLKWSHVPSDKIYICRVAWENPHSEMLMFLLLDSDFMQMLFSSRMFNSQDVISQEMVATVRCHGGGFPALSETNVTLNHPVCHLHSKILLNCIT